MFAGIGIIGALASILASLLLSPPAPDADAVPVADADKPIDPTETTRMRAEMAALREQMESLNAALAESRKADSG
jgi:hypothetical protein